MTDDAALVHATCVAIDGAGVLLRGPSGSGKSDLALRLIDGGARLVADDQVAVSREGRTVTARAPTALGGRIEVRGVGIVEIDPLDAAPVALVVDLAPPDFVERLPARHECDLLGAPVRWMALSPFEASAPAKVRLAVRLATRDITGGIQAP
jgi:serine kinase of HPr protein (carbohydrate metabolism regulator)